MPICRPLAPLLLTLPLLSAAAAAAGPDAVTRADLVFVLHQRPGQQARARPGGQGRRLAPPHDPLVGAPGRYEGAEVKRHVGWWYLFASSTDCCNGPLTGYAVHTGRARRPEGPFLDRLGNELARGRAGGTPVLSQNGKRWIGIGHNTVFTDAAGQWWTIYHGVDIG